MNVLGLWEVIFVLVIIILLWWLAQNVPYVQMVFHDAFSDVQTSIGKYQKPVSQQTKEKNKTGGGHSDFIASCFEPTNIFLNAII